MLFKKEKMMKPIYIGALGSLIVFITACGAASSKDNKGDLNDKKVKLEKLRKEQTSISDSIKKLEDEIAKQDSTFAIKPKLVSVDTLRLQNFTHYIDLQGKVATENIFLIAPRGQGGYVKEVYVKAGDYVKKGQLLIRLDDAMMQQNIKQSETQVAFLKDIYNRQKNLWDQGIGTEVQYLKAKNDVDNTERQIAILKEQLSTSNVFAEVSGIADQVNIKPGEFFGGNINSNTSITIVDPSNLKATVDVPENYISRVRKGMPVVVEVPDANKKINSSISLISTSIDPNSRTFKGEAKIPSGSSIVKPNQVVIVRIEDYTRSNVIVIPVNALQTDQDGKYVYVMVDEKGKKVARKKQVIPGELYGDKIEIKSGLTPGDQLISQGYQNTYDGQVVTAQVQ